MINNIYLMLLMACLEFSDSSFWQGAPHYDSFLGSNDPFSVHVTQMRGCRGPRHTACDAVNYTVTLASPVALHVDIRFEHEMPPLEAKIISKSEMFGETHTITANTVCHDMYLRQVLEHILPVENCHIPAGRYQGVINVNESAHHNRDGRAALPGAYVVKSSFHTSHCNVFCLLLDLVVTVGPYRRLASFNQ